jgi:integrase
MFSMQVTLSDTIINNLIQSNTGNRITVSDSRVQGLAVEIRSRSATFYLRSTVNGTKRRVTLGLFPTLSTAAARKLSMEHKQLHLLEAHKGLLRAVHGIGFAEYFERHFLLWAKSYRRSHGSYASLYRRHLEPRFGSMMVGNISMRHLMNMATDMVAHGYSKNFANKAAQVTRGALKLSEDLCGVDYHITLNKPFPIMATHKVKERYLTDNEALRLRDYVDAHSDDAVVLVLGFLLYTGARRNEAFTAEWQHVNELRRSWFVPITKSGKSRYITLNNSAISIIERAKLLQQQRYDTPQRWLFVNPRTQKPFRCIFHRWNNIRTKLGLDDVRIHDLRHSYASTLVNNGATLYEVQKLLGHSKSQTTERYAHLANHTLIRAASLIDKAFSK